MKGRITLEQFVALSSTNAARIYGMMPYKGLIVPGADADLAIWDPEERWVAGETRDNVDYNPFAGRDITGRPVTVLTRGNRVVEDGGLIASPGEGRFICRAPGDFGAAPGAAAPELAPRRNFGAEVAP